MVQVPIRLPSTAFVQCAKPNASLNKKGGHFKLTKTGSACCVAAGRPHKSPEDDVAEQRRHQQRSFSSHRWGDKSPSDDFEVAVHGPQLHRFSFSSNGGSRSGSRLASSPASHHHTFSESIFSQGVSPSDSFRTSQWNFISGQGGLSGDFIFAIPDPNASPSIVVTSKESFSEAVSSHRERLRWTSASSPSDFVPSQESLDKGDLTLEQIRAAGSLRPPVELLTCGLCARWLSQRSPSHRIFDLPAVGVLSCGHVFHADCLEQSIPQSQKPDPPCPQCSFPEKASKGTLNRELVPPSSSKGIMKSFSHASTSSKNKLSRVGVITDDGPGTTKEAHLSKLPSSSGAKSQLSSFFSERAHLSKSFSKRAFPFRGRRKDSFLGEGKFRKPGSPARVSPEKDFVDVSTHIKEVRSSSFRHS